MWFSSRGGGAALLPVPVLASMLLFFQTTHAGVSRGASHHRPRGTSEHVVLADCVDSNDVLSSQMAYYAQSPNATPEDVAVVETPADESALWVSTTTSALFTKSGVVFTARLGPKVANGQFAGTGDNTFPNPFSCYQKYSNNLYRIGNTTCSMVYDCDHSEPPATTSSTPSASSSASATSSASSEPQADDGASRGLPVGAVIGIAIGAALGAIVLGVSAFLLWRRRRPGRGGKPVELGSEERPFEHPAKNDSPTPQPPASAHPTSAATTTTIPPYWPPQELPTGWQGAEMSGDTRGELDGNPRVEMPWPHARQSIEEFKYQPGQI